MSGSKITMALYRPKEGKETELMDILQSHIPSLRSENLITGREPMMLQSEDSTIIEIFEWKSDAAKDLAHQSPIVMSVWNKIIEVADINSLSSLPEAAAPFPNFKPL